VNFLALFVDHEFILVSKNPPIRPRLPHAFATNPENNPLL
jgi:hypothetical protein